MNIAEDFIKDIINNYQNCVIAVCALLAVVFLVFLIVKLFNISGHLKARNKILERIAAVIEKESEPYVIEKPFEKKTEKPVIKKEEAK